MKKWFAIATVWTKDRRPATVEEVRNALDRIRQGHNGDDWPSVYADAVPGVVGCFLITIPERWEQALLDPDDGRVEVEVRMIPRVGAVKIEMVRAIQMELTH